MRFLSLLLPFLSFGDGLPTIPKACVADSCVLALKPEVIEFNDELDSVMGQRILDGIHDAVEHGDRELTIRIDSPGGRVDYMLQIFDALRKAEHSGTKSRCEVVPDGMAASAAAMILEACTTRVMAPSARLLFHEAAVGGADGKKGDLRRTADHLEDTDTRIATMLAWRLKMTAEQYLAWVTGHDRWLDAPGALQLHAIDVIQS